MKIYTFEKSFQQRLEEFSLVLDENDSGSIKESWKDFLETSTEPAGYKAIWKISRGMCEMLNIVFPAEVFGEVLQTDFEDLTVDFSIEKVQDEKIQLPELCQVPIEDIFPTIFQPNECLNVELTADIFDRYRFFYSYIFLPFDLDDDIKWASKNLESRVQLFYDLKNKKLSKGISSYIRQIIAEVKYIQFKRDILANSIEDNDTSETSKEAIARLLDFHLRMNKIKHEMEILVNSEMREAYESVKFGRKLESNKQTFVISKHGTISDQISLLEKLKEKISTDTTLSYVKDLFEAISCSTTDTEIYIPRGLYSFNFLDYLNNNLLFCGVEKLPNLDVDSERSSVIYSVDKSQMLFVIDGDIKFENLVIDCRNVKIGFSIKNGTIILRNCLIVGLGTEESTVSEAFNISGESSVIFQDCIIRDFATALNIDDASRIEFNDSKIENCNIGMDILSDDVKISFKNSSLVNCLSYGLLRYSDNTDRQIILDINSSDELKRFNMDFSGDNKFIDGASNVIKVIPKLAEDVIGDSSIEEMEA